MKKDKTVHKNTFLTGAFITTLGIIITKLLGIFYVIPFHAIIGDKGGALYGYAYTIYLIFVSLSTAGIPLAISKIICEYQTKGYYKTKKRAFLLGKRIAFILGIISFTILMIFAPIFAKWILGDLVGGNTIEDVTFVIRIISIAVLFVPIISIYRGYFEGHRYMIPPSISQVIEQVVRVLFIIFGSLIALKVFKFNLVNTVSIALLGATIGAASSYIYLLLKKTTNKRKFNERVFSVNEPIISDKLIIRKIILYAIPFVMIDLFKSFYNYVDMVTVVKGLVKYAHFRVSDAEIIMSMLSTWANKFNMIVTCISTGIIVSIIPNLTKSIVENNQKDIDKKVNQSINLLLLFTVPMTVGISILSNAIWILFYGPSKYGPSVLSVSIFIALFCSLFTLLVTIIQIFKDYKTEFISLFVGFVIKILLNIKLMIAFNKMGVPAYYGVIMSSIIAYIVASIICFIKIKRHCTINYEKSIKYFIDIFCASMLMMIVLLLLRFIIPIYSLNRIVNIFIIIFYGIIGAIIYILFLHYSGTLKEIVGNYKKIKRFK